MLLVFIFRLSSGSHSTSLKLPPYIHTEAVLSLPQAKNGHLFTPLPTTLSKLMLKLTTFMTKPKEVIYMIF